MEESDIQKEDPEFNFEEVFKRNYITLLNVFVCEVGILMKYKFDGVEKEISNPEGKMFSLQYRIFMEESKFEFEPGNFFSTEALALKHLKDNIQNYGLTKLSKEEAIGVARRFVNMVS